MFNYYTAITILTWISLGVLSILVQENGRISRETKSLFILTNVLIAVSALAEWLGVYFDGRTDQPEWPLRVAKCCDYILTPIAGGTLLSQIKLRPFLRKMLYVLLAVNTVFQIVSAFFGWMITIDSARHYVHGPLYFVYVYIYVTVILLVIVGFITYGKDFSKPNRTSLYAVLLLIIGGVAMQELINLVRTAYITLTMSATLLFIHYTEFSQQSSDQHIQEQQVLITTDALTGIRSRFSYTEALERYDAMETLPENLAVFSIDLNNLKPTNDRIGHAAGDELICGAARIIDKAFKNIGECYRVGGDEFVVIAGLTKQSAEQLFVRLKTEAVAWRGKLVNKLSFAVGYVYAADCPGMKLADIVRKADESMYADKTEYYRRTGRDRRAAPQEQP